MISELLAVDAAIVTLYLEQCILGNNPAANQSASSTAKDKDLLMWP
jgi:hypothetical protein